MTSSSRYKRCPHSEQQFNKFALRYVHCAGMNAERRKNTRCEKKKADCCMICCRRSCNKKVHEWKERPRVAVQRSTWFQTCYPRYHVCLYSEPYVEGSAGNCKYRLTGGKYPTAVHFSVAASHLRRCHATGAVEMGQRGAGKRSKRSRSLEAALGAPWNAYCVGCSKQTRRLSGSPPCSAVSCVVLFKIQTLTILLGGAHMLYKRSSHGKSSQES